MVVDIKPNLEILDSIKITEITLTNHLKSSNSSKTAGMDGINVRTENELANGLTPILKHSSMGNGAIPSQWKNAHVTTLFKWVLSDHPKTQDLLAWHSYLVNFLKQLLEMQSVDKQGPFIDDQHGRSGIPMGCDLHRFL